MLVRKVDGNCSDWVEVTDVVCSGTVVTDVEVEEDVVVEEEVLEPGEEDDEAGAELVVVAVLLVEAGVVEVVVLVEVVVALLLVPTVTVLTELLEEVNIPLTPTMSAAARMITTIITAMIILPTAGLSSAPDRSFNCNLVVLETRRRFDGDSEKRCVCRGLIAPPPGMITHTLGCGFQPKCVNDSCLQSQIHCQRQRNGRRNQRRSRRRPEADTGY